MVDNLVHNVRIESQVLRLLLRWWWLTGEHVKGVWHPQLVQNDIALHHRALPIECSSPLVDSHILGSNHRRKCLHLIHWLIYLTQKLIWTVELLAIPVVLSVFFSVCILGHEHGLSVISRRTMGCIHSYHDRYVPVELCEHSEQMRARMRATFE